MKGLVGKTALVTGAAQGIGEGIACRLAAEGMQVALMDLNGDAVERLATGICALPGQRALALQGNVSDEADVRRVVQETSALFGGVHAVVNNAGVDITAAPRDVTRDRWNRVHDVDLWGAMLVVRECEDLLAREGGAIINIASTHAIATVEGRSTYAAAKAGLVGMARGLAIDLGPRGIRVNTILPGYIRTPIWSLWLDEAPDPERLLDRIAQRHPLRRLGTPGDVAGAVAFLCSDDASFITGATLVIDGGNTALLESPLE